MEQSIRVSDKVIFLDIDGVLTSARAYNAFNIGEGLWKEFDPVAVNLLKNVLEVGKFLLVISSSWRLSAKKMLFTQLKKHTLYQYLHPDWATPAKMSSSRGDEIWMWLENHKEVTHYVIIDDNTDMHSDQMRNFIRTDGTDGMLFEHYDDLVRKAGLTHEEIRKFYAPTSTIH